MFLFQIIHIHKKMILTSTGSRTSFQNLIQTYFGLITLHFKWSTVVFLQQMKHNSTNTPQTSFTEHKSFNFITVFSGEPGVFIKASVAHAMTTQV